MASANRPSENEIAEEDLLRAQLYRLLARLLASPPGEGDLSLAAQMRGDETELGQAIAMFAELARRTGPEAVRREYHDLFIGLGRGELLPYASYYLTGFLHEKPLAALRDDMARLGIACEDGMAEPEDHMAALCEMMAGLIDGAFGEAASLAEQKAFFEAHLHPWAKHFFKDLEAAKSSLLYAGIGRIGRVFMDIEDVAFSMA